MKNLIIKSTIIFLLLFCFTPLFSQVLTKKQFNKAVEEADISYYYELNYEKAAGKYESLLKSYPDNSNLSAKLGICYLNIDGKKAEAMKLLEKASKNVVSNEKEYQEYGEKAPLDTYMYRAIAYHKNDSLRKAILLYNDAKKRLAGTETFHEDYINNQIRDCMYALEMKKKPLTIISKLFAPWLKDYPGACNPVLSKNDSVFVFTVKEAGKTRILCSYKSGSWKTPVDITRQLGGFDRFYSNSITGDGRQLIIYMDDGGDGNLYYSLRKDTVWTRIKSIGKPVNTIYWQSNGFITPDGKTLFFSSNKPGGEGGLDIWYSKKTKTGTWSEPTNCGNVINTPYNEDTPFFDTVTGTLYFSSDGHTSMGGLDMFRSVLRNGVWSTPTGMPFAFNTTDANSFFILNNSTPGFITSLYDEKENARNIYSVVALEPADKITTAMGSVTLGDGMNIDPQKVQILLSDIKKGSPVKKISLIDSSSFKFDIKPGDYQVFVSVPGYKTDTINLNVPLFFQGNYITVNATLMPDKVFEGDFLSIKNILFEYASYKLDDQAISILMTLKNILLSYPELKIEIAGYTDSKGGTEYNTKLADNRAQTIIDYLGTSGISVTRFVKKSFGKSNFVAINTNPDGSDNPEGRKYNRRATFGIVDPGTGLIIRQDSYTPEHLRNPNAMKYSVVLLKTTEKYSPDYFNELIKNDMLFVRTIKLDNVSMYVLGVFYNKADALKYMTSAKEKGLDKAYVLNQYELDNESKGIVTPVSTETAIKVTRLVYTVQLIATRNPLNISRVFAGIDGITEFKADDGFYKYFYGEYKTLSEAKDGLAYIKGLWHNEVFIRQIDVEVFK
jgi:outer membrane protein OmpA-like peptidoglycan-associated protein/tetratricopeptide (TPR) repeat protein